MRIPQVLAGIIVLLLAVACKGPEETVVQQVPPPVVKDTTITEPEPVREFAFTERYFVPGSALGDPTKVDDALQAMRVIQLVPGSSNVLVIAAPTW